MSSPAIHFQLFPFKKTYLTQQFELTGKLFKQKNLWQIDYCVVGDLAFLELPELNSSHEFKENLWQSTCFELFCRPSPPEPDYMEWNFSPSGDWWSAHFDIYREPSTQTPAQSAPHLQIRSSEKNKLEMSVEMDFPTSPAPHVGISAVLNIQNTNTHWALGHPREKADFHDPKTFLIHLK